MKSVSKFLKSRVALLVFVLAALGITLGALPPVQEAQAACAFSPAYTEYYSDATHTEVVGQRGTDCSCNPFSWGVVTPFHVLKHFCCSVNTC